MNRKNIIKTILIITSLIYLSGCTTLSRTEKRTLLELKSCGIASNEMTIKHPAVAGALNILPGAGNFYLAANTEETPQWTYGFVNLLAWPFSPIWAVPQASIDASTINKRELVNYYLFTKEGQKEYNKLMSEKTL